MILLTNSLKYKRVYVLLSTATSSWTANISSLVFDSVCVLLFPASRPV